MVWQSYEISNSMLGIGKIMSRDRNKQKYNVRNLESSMSSASASPCVKSAFWENFKDGLGGPMRIMFHAHGFPLLNLLLNLSK